MVGCWRMYVQTYFRKAAFQNDELLIALVHMRSSDHLVSHIRDAV